jgi:HK97 family phage prohead protease
VRTWHDIEFRVVDQVARTAEIRVCVYNVVDDYGSVWVPGCWRGGLTAKLPKGTWAHDWTDIIGRAISYTDGADDLKLLVKFSDFDAVPRALQAWTQLRDGDVDEFSFGFERRRWEIVNQDAGTMGTADGEPDEGMDDIPDGCRERITEAIMHEWSPVLVGAVPGTGVLAGSVRSSRALRALNSEGMVDAQIVGDLAVQLAAGEIDLLGALEKIREAAGGGTLILSTPEKPKEPDKPAAPTTEPSKEPATPPASDAAAEMTEKLLEAVTAEAQAAKAGAEAATQAEADALILAADTALDGLGRAH